MQFLGGILAVTLLQMASSTKLFTLFTLDTREQTHNFWFLYILNMQDHYTQL